MKKIVVLVCVLVLPLALLDPESCWGGRGLRGGGGGFRAGGGGVVHTYGGSASGFRTSTPVVGPIGGTGQYGRVGGSVTTPGGSTINYRGGGFSGTTPGGIQGGKYVGGIHVSTPGGKDFAKVGTGGVAVGPGGKMVGGKTGVTVGSGPQGSFATKYQGGVAIGPHGGVAGKSRVGVVNGPGGTVIGSSRAGVAYNPYGAVAGRTTVVAGRGTYYRSATAIQGQAVYVRRGVATYPCFRPAWYTRNPGAWFAAGWVARSVWRPAPWATYAPFFGYAGQPVYYDYGENVVYQDDGVYVNGYRDASAEQYAQQAITLADTGRQAKATKEEEWLPLGVFAMVQGEEQTSNHLFQLAVNQQGVLRGNYYDAVTDTTTPVYGSVDRKTQRAAWTVGMTKTPVYECGMANLTKNEMTMLVHYGQERTQQFALIRVEDPEKTQ